MKKESRILFYAALLHDVIIYKKDRHYKKNGSNESARFAEILLNKLSELNKDKIKLSPILLSKKKKCQFCKKRQTLVY